MVQAPADPGEVELGALGAFQRRNFALARAAAEAYLGAQALDPTAVASAARDVLVPGRLQIVGQRPLTLLDGAHNPDGIAALAESMPAITASHNPVIAVVSILDDKDAAGMLAALMPACDALVVTSSHNPRSLPPPTLQSLARQVLTTAPPAEVVPGPHRALARARELAGPGGVVIAAGSLYLIADLMASGPRERASTL